MGPQPGAQKRPETLKRIDVDLTEAIAVLVTGILPGGVVDALRG
jgi:hypothetical protein